MLRSFIFIIFLISFSAATHAQNVLTSYGFNTCTYEDDNTSFPGLSPIGGTTCVCGINGMSISFDGTGVLAAPPITRNIFNQNFTLDFYFTLNPVAEETHIFSFRNGCNNLDSLMSFRFINSTNQLVFDLGSNVNNYHTIKTIPNNDICWHRFTLVKFGLLYNVYLDNLLVGEIVARENIEFTKLAPLAFGFSPCTSANSSNFTGLIDEIKIYDRALSELEINRAYLFPSRINIDDQTIFLGESIELTSNSVCANSIIWSPSTTLDNSTIDSPIATPTVSTTYYYNVSAGACSSVDTVRIYVADPNQIDCKNLLLPSAFTPNNDGLNDAYGISNTFIIEQLLSFEVFNRSGSKLFETSSIDGSWDGTFNGTPVQANTYIYKVRYQCKGNEEIKLGSFVLIR